MVLQHKSWKVNAVSTVQHMLSITQADVPMGNSVIVAWYVNEVNWAAVYLIVHNHELGVDIDLEAPVLLSTLVGAASRGGGRGLGLPFPKRLLIACNISTT